MVNTVKIGDAFEERCYKLVQRAVDNGEFGIDKGVSRIFRKKSYSGTKRKSIIFDLSIEVWPKGAKRYSLLIIIECKSYSGKVPVCDIEEFHSKIIQVSDTVKGVLITDSGFQFGCHEFAENGSMMLIQVNQDDEYNIIYHKRKRNKISENNLKTEAEIYENLKNALGLGNVEGLKHLSKEKIEDITKKLIDKFNISYKEMSTSNIINFIQENYNVTFILNKFLEKKNGRKIEGYYDSSNKTIFIDKDVVNSNKFKFVLGHELGHFFFHSNLKLNKYEYNLFEDSEFDKSLGIHKLENDKHWIERQANRFSISLFLPKNIFIEKIIDYRKNNLGINNPEIIYLDDQKCNRIDYIKTIDYISEYFNTSKIAVQYRIEDLDLITFADIKHKGLIGN